jgi:hypothetical protein
MTAETPCTEIAADALALAALPAEAPERARAEEHARGCAACARALAEAREMMAMLGVAAPPPPSPAALARAAAPVLADLDALAGARASAGRIAGAVAAAVLAAWALPLALSRGPLNPGSALSFALAALAAAASVATVRWGGRVAAVFPVLSALTALAVGRGPALDATFGCPMVEALTAAGAGAAAWLAARTLARAAPSPQVIVAAVGGGALAGHAALHLACGAATELPHLLVFHTGPVVLAVGLALLFARGVGPATESSRP